MTEENSQQTPMMSAGTHKSITIEEYDRLKRENEGFKYKISQLNKIITDGKDAYYRLQRELNDKNYYSSQLFEENKKLKRLEENVKNEIEERVDYAQCSSAMETIGDEISLLESLSE